MKYLVSRVWTSNYCSTSFEKISDIMFQKFYKLERKKLLLEEFSGKHYDEVVELNKYWKLEEIQNENEIIAINLIWKYLPHHDHIQRCYYDEDNYSKDYVCSDDENDWENDACI